MVPQITSPRKLYRVKDTTSQLIGEYTMSILIIDFADFLQVVSGNFDLRNAVWFHTILGRWFSNENL